VIEEEEESSIGASTKRCREYFDRDGYNKGTDIKY
jgi:hypothetical protein